MLPRVWSAEEAKYEELFSLLDGSIVQLRDFTTRKVRAQRRQRSRPPPEDSQALLSRPCL
jgi:hypothetical protein